MVPAVPIARLPDSPIALLPGSVEKSDPNTRPPRNPVVTGRLSSMRVERTHYRERGMSAAAICFSAFVGCLVGSFVPFVNSELIILSAAAIAPPGLTIPLILIAALTQMLAKSVLYLAGSGLLHLPEGRATRRLHEALARVQRWQNTGALFLFSSASFGLPPFYLVSVAAGALRLPFPRFFLLGLIGRVLRFSAVVIVPQAIKSAL